MSTSPVINALIEKRAELAGYLADLERRAIQCRADLVHLDSTLRMFKPDFEPDGIAPKAPAPRRSQYFPKGGISRFCLDTLRRAKGVPISAHDIAARAMRERGLNLDDARLKADFVRRVQWSLNSIRKRGLV